MLNGSVIFDCGHTSERCSNHHCEIATAWQICKDNPRVAFRTGYDHAMRHIELAGVRALGDSPIALKLVSHTIKYSSHGIP